MGRSLSLPEPISRTDFIAGMRDVSASVTVVTTDGPAGRHGATVSAFCSVSADPPSLLVCLNASSRVAEAVLKNERFCVNVLREGQQAVANRFAGLDDATLCDRFEGIEFSSDLGGVPVLAGSTAFSCSVASVVEKGSHFVILGDVDQLQVTGATPQTYWAGTYRTIAPTAPACAV